MRRRWTLELHLSFGPEPDPQLVEDKIAYTQAEHGPDYHTPEMHIGFRGES